MKFLWPELLWLLASVPLLVAGYVMLLRRRKRAALQYGSFAVLKNAQGAAVGMRRFVPPLLLLLALIALLLAVARPAAVIMLPTKHEMVILAMDTSSSMRATDVKPTRLAAAQAAAKAFIEKLPQSTRVGIVSFAGTAALVQTPTQSREDVIEAIDRFQVQRGTAVGSGIVIALAAIFPGAGIDEATLLYGRANRRGYSLDEARAPEMVSKSVAPGSYQEAAIVLLTDGQATTGPDSLEAARMAAERGVRIYTVGIGTAAGETIGYEGWSMRVRLDEETLKGIANATHGDYFYAGNAKDLMKVYAALSSRLTVERKDTEIGSLFAAAAAILVLIAAALSMLWFNRIL